MTIMMKIVVPLSKATIAVVVLFYAVGPVSYTHLDVYTRQGQYGNVLRQCVLLSEGPAIAHAECAPDNLPCRCMCCPPGHAPAFRMPVCHVSSRFNLKKGIFLTILHLPAVVNAAELLPLVVVVTLVAYSAAKGGPRPVNAKQ